MRLTPRPVRGAPFIWCGMPTAGVARDTLNRFDEILDDEEHERIDRLRSLQARCDTTIAHGLRRLLLASVTGRPPESFRFRTETRGGKPQAVGLAGIDFSLTHCSGYAAAAAGRLGRIGIDAEPVAREIEPELVAPGSGGPPIVLWTFKEALAKAEGSGLALDLRRLEVDTNGPRLIAAPRNFGAPEGWLLEGHRHDGFTIAIAFGPGARA